MIRGLYSAATGQDAAILNQNIVAQNLAHATVPGYRRQGIVFTTFEQAVAQAALPTAPGAMTAGPPAVQTTTGNATDSLLGTQSSGTFTAFESGPLEYTGNPLDVAATGDAFFVVQGPGGELLTRNGSFRLNADNQLVNPSGFLVRGQGGPITFPPDAREITITLDGVIMANNQEVGRLLLAQVPFPQMLERAGTTVFSGGVPRGQPEPGTVRIEQGYREGSNVQAVTELVSMIAGLRLYQASDRALRSLSEALGLQTRPQT